MSEKQFDAFDEPFRKAAEEYEPPYNEEAWKKMETMLDTRKRNRRPLAWWWLTDAIMVGLMMYMAFSFPAHRNNTLPGNNSRENTTKPVYQNNPSNDQRIINGNKGSQTIAPAQKQATPVYNHANENTNASTTASYSEKNSNPVSGTGAFIKNQLKSSTQNLKESNSILLPATKENEQIITENGQLASIQPPVSNIAKDNKSVSLPPQEKQLAATETGIEKSVEEPTAVAGTKNKNKTASVQKGFYLYVNGGPEWTFVPGNEVGPTTFAFGGGIGYQFAKRWAVQAGIFATQKNYAAGPGDYKAKPGNYYYNLTINSVEAKCTVTEIPVVLKFGLSQRAKSALYASAGISSLIMNREEYHYDYIRVTGQPGYASHIYQTNKSEISAGFLLSAGYAVKAGKQFSFAAEPYIKLPIYGVGEGNVKISSFGIMLGAQYNLPSFRKQK